MGALLRPVLMRGGLADAALLRPARERQASGCPECGEEWARVDQEIERVEVLALSALCLSYRQGRVTTTARCPRGHSWFTGMDPPYEAVDRAI